MARRAKSTRKGARKSTRKPAKRKAVRRTAARRGTARKTAARKIAKRPARKAARKRRAPAAAARRMAAVTPHIVLSDASGAIAFYKRAFGAEELYRMPAPDGRRLMHATIRIGGTEIMMCDEFPEMGTCRAPTSLGGTSATLHLNVANADAAFGRAVDAGCSVTMPLADMFWGDRYGKLRDPYGHEWSIGQHVRDVAPDEIARAVASFPSS